MLSFNTLLLRSRCLARGLPVKSFLTFFPIRSTSRFYSDDSFNLRPGFEIALRAASLQLVLSRWGMEMATKMEQAKGSDPENDERRAKAVNAITETALNGGLVDSLTEKEMNMLKKDQGTWEYEDFQYGKYWESLGILSWLLGRRNEVPQYFSSFDRVKLFQSTGILPGDPNTIDSFINSFMSTQGVFSIKNSILKREIDLAEIWYWRSRMQVLIDLKDQLAKSGSNTTPDSSSSSNLDSQNDDVVQQQLENKRIPHSLRRSIKDSQAILEAATKRAIELGLLDQKIDSDFAVIVETDVESPQSSQNSSNGNSNSRVEIPIPYEKLEKKDHDALMDIAEARLMAFAWATGKLDAWDPKKMANIGSINPLNVLWSPE
ncbi:hypothetical protein AYI68_g6158 [Smittium mucronatum]|uniref:Uncharacterized protein n=1 Tax=Smittium mucronatum TaxID=133383 RepID=A0A1R0GRZ2_9FUNG|nr:hypothetical protein AYI68_g6279 [Smittium mucronatum]OLY79763.1 hypothetical protein AYI68_g6158 [Smittium mucronatum]